MHVVVTVAKLIQVVLAYSLGLETVPLLIETAKRLLEKNGRGDLPEEEKLAVESIAADRDHGAIQLASWAVEALEKWGAAR